MTLKPYPKLQSWYQSMNDATSPAESLLYKICDAIEENQGFEALLIRLSQSQSYLDETLILCLSQNAELPQLLAVIAERSIQANLGHLAFSTFKNLADKTDDVAIRFLSAWTAFNINAIETSLAECDKIVDTYAPVYSLMGQAYLESGKINDAVECLETATRLLPHDALSWFQLSKSYHLKNNLEKAINCIKICLEKEPKADDALLYLAILSVESSENSSITQNAMTLTTPLAKRHPKNLIVAKTLLELAAQTNNFEAANTVVSSVQWPELRNSEDFLKNLPTILKVLNTNSWHSLAHHLLTQLTAQP